MATFENVFLSGLFYFLFNRADALEMFLFVYIPTLKVEGSCVIIFLRFLDRDKIMDETSRPKKDVESLGLLRKFEYFFPPANYISLLDHG